MLIMIIGNRVTCSHPINYLSDSCIHVFILYFNVVTDIPFLIVPGMIFVGVGGLGLLVINIKAIESHTEMCLHDKKPTY